MAMGWVVRFRSLLFLAALADIAIVGQAERPESFKAAKHAMKHSHRKPKTEYDDAGFTKPAVRSTASADDDEYDAATKKKVPRTKREALDIDQDDDIDERTDADGDDDNGATGKAIGDEFEPEDVGVENITSPESGDTGDENSSPEDQPKAASEPCLESEGDPTSDSQCAQWSPYGCIWKSGGWCVHKYSKLYQKRKPKLEVIFAAEEELGADEDEDDDTNKQVEEVGALRSKALSQPARAPANVNLTGDDPLLGNDSQVSQFTPDQDFNGEHYKNTKEVGMKVGQLVKDAHHQIYKNGGLHVHADEAKYKSDVYHHTLQGFESDLAAYKSGVAHFRQTAAEAHHAKTENLKEELVKAPHAKIQVNQDIVHEALRTAPRNKKPHP